MILGFVLTLSPLAGKQLLDKAGLRQIQSRPGTRAALDESSFIGYFMAKYAQSGTKDWPVKSTTWFVVEVLTQLAITPFPFPSRTPVPSLQSAYTPIVRDLVRNPPFANGVVSDSYHRKFDEALNSKETNLSTSFVNTFPAWTKFLRFIASHNES